MTMSISEQKRNEWRARIERSRAAKGTIVDFCKAEGVTENSFYQWRQKLDRQPLPKAISSARQADFAPIRLVGSAVTNQRVSVKDSVIASVSATTIVQLAGGTRLEIPMSDPDAFERAIVALVRADAQEAKGASC